MKNFKAQVEEVVKENEQLHQQLSKNSSVATKEWQVCCIKDYYTISCYGSGSGWTSVNFIFTYNLYFQIIAGFILFAAIL